MNQPYRLTKYRITLPGNQRVELFAASDAAACIALEQLKPGTSGQIVRVDREEFWVMKTDAARVRA